MHQNAALCGNGLTLYRIKPIFNDPAERTYMPYVPYCPGQSRILILCPGIPEIMKLSRRSKK